MTILAGPAVVGVCTPSCADCSAEMSRRFGGQCKALVERFTLVRDIAASEYRVIVHCHGASEVVSLGPELPDDWTLSRVVAFKEGNKPHGK